MKIAKIISTLVFLANCLNSAHSAGEAIPARISNASGSLGSFEGASDGNFDTYWNSGGPPTQWVDLDLGFDQRIRQVRLLVLQQPEGMTNHNVYGRSQAGEWFYLGAFAEYTYDYQWLTLNIDSSARMRYIVVETTNSPSWVAWREIVAHKPYPQVRGNVENKSLTRVSGWACEYREGGPRAIHIYRSDNKYLGGGSTQLQREPAVQTACESNSSQFGFDINLEIPDNLLDGKKYTISSHLIFRDGTNAIIPGSFEIQFGNPTPSPPQPPAPPTAPILPADKPPIAPYKPLIYVTLPGTLPPNYVPITRNWPCGATCPKDFSLEKLENIDGYIHSENP